MKFLVGWLIGIGLVAHVVAGIVYWSTRHPQPERVYSVRYGTVLCGNMEVEPCGVRLWNCHDERVYVCLHDVRYGGGQ